jgi:hypothetical protein
MGHRQAGQAVGHQYDIAGMPGYRALEDAGPLGPIRMIPVALLHPAENGVMLFPKALPMAGTRRTEPGQDQEAHILQG